MKKNSLLNEALFFVISKQEARSSCFSQRRDGFSREKSRAEARNFSG
jgi:hypothetical protein